MNSNEAIYTLVCYAQFNWPFQPVVFGRIDPRRRSRWSAPSPGGGPGVRTDAYNAYW